MKLWLVTLIAVALHSSAVAQEFQRYTFSDIKWLSAPAVVVAQLEAEGFVIDGTGIDENNTLNFTGLFAGEDVVGTATFVEQQLLKLDLFVPTVDIPASQRGTAAADIASSIQAALTEQHGTPTQEAEDAAVWLTAEVSGYVGGILLEVDDDEDVAIIHESPRWAFFIDELQGGGIEAF
jgi:hypothetical protein